MKKANVVPVDQKLGANVVGCDEQRKLYRCLICEREGVNSLHKYIDECPFYDERILISENMIDLAMQAASEDGHHIDRITTYMLLCIGLETGVLVSDNLMSDFMTKFPNIKKSTIEDMLDIAIGNME